MKSQLPLLRMVNLKGRVSIFDQLRIEELFLRHNKDNWFITNTGNFKPSIVLGISGKANELVDLASCIKHDIPLIRRFSGGGTVIVDDYTLFATFVLNEEDIGSKAYPREIMAWTQKVSDIPLYLSHYTRSYILSMQIYSPVFEQLLSGEDKFSLRENDYIIGDLKIGGNAQSISKNRLVHHTSFLWDYRPDRMSYLKIPRKRPVYRGERGHTAFLTKMKEYIPDRGAFETGVSQSLRGHFDVDIIEFDDFIQHTNDVLRTCRLEGRNLDSLSRTVLIDKQHELSLACLPPILS